MSEGKRRIDRIRQPDFVDDLGELDLGELRSRRDECRDELDHLSMLRRFVQGRAEILRGEQERRGGEPSDRRLVDDLGEILSAESTDHPRSESRGGAIRIGVPEEEMLLARRRIEKLVADAGLTDPSELSDADLERAVAELVAEERAVSSDRHAVIDVLDVLQDELKRRFKEDPASVLT